MRFPKRFCGKRAHITATMKLALLVSILLLLAGASAIPASHEHFLQALDGARRDLQSTSFLSLCRNVDQNLPGYTCDCDQPTIACFSNVPSCDATGCANEGFFVDVTPSLDVELVSYCSSDTAPPNTITCLSIEYSNTLATSCGVSVNSVPCNFCNICDASNTGVEFNCDNVSPQDTSNGCVSLGPLPSFLTNTGATNLGTGGGTNFGGGGGGNPGLFSGTSAGSSAAGPNPAIGVFLSGFLVLFHF